MSTTPARKPVTPSHERPAWFAPGLLRKDVEELFQNFFSGVPAIWNDTGNLPSIDVSETDALVEVSTDLPE